jgi:hypothetical protein
MNDLMILSNYEDAKLKLDIKLNAEAMITVREANLKSK